MGATCDNAIRTEPFRFGNNRAIGGGTAGLGQLAGQGGRGGSSLWKNLRLELRVVGVPKLRRKADRCSTPEKVTQKNVACRVRAGLGRERAAAFSGSLKK